MRSFVYERTVLVLVLPRYREPVLSRGSVHLEHGGGRRSNGATFAGVFGYHPHRARLLHFDDA